MQTLKTRLKTTWMSSNYAHFANPTNRAFAALDEAGQAALRRDLEQLWARENRATDGASRYGSEYLEVIAVRA
jgi:hypothetical protein